MSFRAGALLVFVAGVGLIAIGLLVPARGAGVAKRPSVARRTLDAAGLTWPAGVLGALSASAALVAAALGEAVTGLIVVALLAAVAAGPLPFVAVGRRAAARRRAVVDAWPDAIDAVLAAVRSGDSLPSAVTTAAVAGPAALRPALTAVSEEARASGDFGGAIRGLADRLGDPVSRQVSGALLLAHEVGGRELTSVLRDLAAFVREERALRRELEARQSWTVNAARVAAAGPWLVLLFLSLRGDTREAFRGSGGTAILMIGAALTAAGYRLMVVLGRLPDAGRGVE